MQTLVVMVLERWNVVHLVGQMLEHDSVSFVEVSKIFVMQHIFFFGTISTVDRVFVCE